MYLFGGESGLGVSSELWKFNSSTYSWTLFGGIYPNLEGAIVNGTTVWPAGRAEGALWSSGSTLWLTGGYGNNRGTIVSIFQPYLTYVRGAI